MSDPTITNQDTGQIELEGGQFRDALLTFGGSDTFAAGTVLCRGTGVAITPGSNTGDMTLGYSVTGPLKPGTYTLVAGTLSSGLGVWTLTDPFGVEETFDTSGGNDDDDLVFETLGLTVTVTDAGSDTAFVTADSASIVVSAGNFQPFAVTDPEPPSAVLTYAVTRSTAGNEPCRVLVAGTVNKDRLILDADGNGSNITDVHLDQLRGFGIVALDVAQLGQQDNQ